MKAIKRMEHDLVPRKTHYDTQMKLRMLYAIEQGVHIDIVAKSFGVSRRALYEWNEKYQERGLEGLEAAPRTGRPPLLPDKKIKKCIDNIARRCEILTAKKLREEIHKVHGILYSEDGVRKILARNGLTYKKAMTVHARSATNEEASEWRKKNIPKIRKLCSENYTLVSLDEATAELNSPARYGYAEKGEKLHVIYHGTKQKTCVFGVITQDGKRIFRTAEKLNSITFRAFMYVVKRVLGKKIVMLLDQATYHTSKTIKKWFAKNPTVKTILLPTASPHMNSIENIWGIGKSDISNTIHHDIKEFRADFIWSLRKCEYDADIYKRVFKRLDDPAEKLILDARRKHKLLAVKLKKK